MEQLPADKLIILYDGQCRLCNRWVKFVLLHDPKDQFRFLSQESELGKKLLDYLAYPTSTRDTMVVYDPKVAYYVEAEAVLQICKHGDLGLQLLQIFRIFPKPILNVLYHMVARNRYSWFGKELHCVTVNPRYAHKFLN